MMNVLLHSRMVRRWNGNFQLFCILETPQEEGQDIDQVYCSSSILSQRYIRRKRIDPASRCVVG